MATSFNRSASDLATYTTRQLLDLVRKQDASKGDELAEGEGVKFFSVYVPLTRDSPFSQKAPPRLETFYCLCQQEKLYFGT